MLLTVYTTSSSTPYTEAKISDFYLPVFYPSVNRARLVKILKRFRLLPATVEARLSNAGLH